IVAIGIIDEKKRELVMPASENVEVPIIEKHTAQVLSVSGDSANVMDTETYETFDMPIPADLKSVAVEGAQMLYWDILGQKVMKSLRSGSDD
ncbi:MAG: translation initiation factor IF-5A, partial [Candidatus Woesearchaeota archaeon]|nr:translation initiation factor IF-5A [Candidatus Woesearchaeota archaeon]